MRSKAPLVLVGLALQLNSVHSADFTKAGNTDNLNIGSSWVGGIVPGSADVAVWNSSSTGATPVSLGANLTLGQIRIESGAPSAVTINPGNTLTLNGVAGTGINLSSTGQNLTIEANVTLGASQTWTAGSGRVLTVNGVIDDGASSFNLTASGGSTVALGGLNTFDGVVTTGNGTISVTNLADGGFASSLGDSTNAAANLIISGGGSLTYTGSTNASTDRLFTISGSSTANAQGSLTNNGSGTVSFTNTSGLAYSGSGVGATRVLRLAGTNTGANTYAGAIADNAGNAVSLTKADSGRWEVTSASSSYTGATTIAGTLGVVKLSDGGVNSSIGASTNAASNLLLSNGAVFEYLGSGDSTDRQFTFNSNGTMSATLSSSGTGAVNFTSTASPTNTFANQNRTLTLSGTNTGTNTLSALLQNNGTGVQSLNKTGGGTWVLTNANTYTGTTAVSGGTLLISNSSGSGTGSGQVNITGAGSTLGGTGILAQGSSNTITAGNGTFIAPGSGGIGTLRLSGQSTTGAILTMNSGSSFSFDFGTLNSSDAIDFWFYGGASDLVLNSNAINGSNVQEGTFTLFRFFTDAGSTPVSSIGFSSGLTVGTGFSGFNTALNYNADSITLNVSVIPEPSTWALMALALASLPLARRLAGRARR